jgi:tmRNA-binding protein
MSNAYQKKESAKKGSINTFVVNTNKKALFDFEIIKNYEAGIELL